MVDAGWLSFNQNSELHSQSIVNEAGSGTYLEYADNVQGDKQANPTLGILEDVAASRGRGNDRQGSLLIVHLWLETG